MALLSTALTLVTQGSAADAQALGRSVGQGGDMQPTATIPPPPTGLPTPSPPPDPTMPPLPALPATPDLGPTITPIPTDIVPIPTDIPLSELEGHD
jgi:hypothetical protein